jgi:hypothetical protein
MMGWSSGTTLFEHVIETVQFHVPDFDTRYNMYVELVSAFGAHDWDNLDEVVGIDPAYDQFYNEFVKETDED